MLSQQREVLLSLFQINVLNDLHHCWVSAEARKDIIVDLRERLNGYITKIDHSFALENYEYVIDNIHDTDTFRLFLNKRVENKAVFNKEKMEVYT